MTADAPHPAAEQRARRDIAVTAAGALGGIALSVVGHAALGGWVTVGSIVLLVASLHRLGRLGPDE